MAKDRGEDLTPGKRIDRRACASELQAAKPEASKAGPVKPDQIEHHPIKPGAATPGSGALIAAFYKFEKIDDLQQRKTELQAACKRESVVGTILLAEEGVNGTIAGAPENVMRVLDVIRSMPGFDDLPHKESWADRAPFFRPKVRVKKEIVSIGVEGADPRVGVGRYVPPTEWNGVLNDPDVVVVDVRKDFEVAAGTFDGAQNPQTDTFREFPAWLRQLRDEKPDAKLAMFCTGGIRCEKATALALSIGFEDVSHLEGGILKYLETVPEADSRWRGECFVFDNRVTVDHSLNPGTHILCSACRRPLSESDVRSKDYERGVSCAYCVNEHSAADRARFAEREKQIDLAKARGEDHLGKKRAANQSASKPEKQIKKPLDWDASPADHILSLDALSTDE
ncbi:MAG: rhodanese-related sulfurtransferase [Pseudomonadota bacterium]